jgi:hypothetical protein
MKAFLAICFYHRTNKRAEFFHFCFSFCLMRGDCVESHQYFVLKTISSYNLQ